MSSQQPLRLVLAVTGLIAEARIASGAGILTLVGGGDGARLALNLQAALARGAKAVISFGIAGGLQPGLSPGMTIVARSVSDRQTRMDADPAWTDRLCKALPHAVAANLLGTDEMIVGRAGKAALYRETGAAAVDMESHIAARLAALHQVPFAAIRVIADPAERTLPHAATVGMRPDGSTDVGAVLRSLARRPGDLPGLIRTAFDAKAAFASLGRNRKQLGPTLGFDVSEEPSSWSVGFPATISKGTGAFSPETQTEKL